MVGFRRIPKDTNTTNRAEKKWKVSCETIPTLTAFAFQMISIASIRLFLRIIANHCKLNNFIYHFFGNDANAPGTIACTCV